MAQADGPRIEIDAPRIVTRANGTTFQADTYTFYQPEAFIAYATHFGEGTSVDERVDVDLHLDDKTEIGSRFWDDGEYIAAELGRRAKLWLTEDQAIDLAEELLRTVAKMQDDRGE